VQRSRSRARPRDVQLDPRLRQRSSDAFDALKGDLRPHAVFHRVQLATRDLLVNFGPGRREDLGRSRDRDKIGSTLAVTAATAMLATAVSMVVGIATWMSGMPKNATTTQQIKTNALIISDASEHCGVADRHCGAAAAWAAHHLPKSSTAVRSSAPLPKKSNRPSDTMHAGRTVDRLVRGRATPWSQGWPWILETQLR
jgi:hypothetical protein